MDTLRIVLCVIALLFFGGFVFMLCCACCAIESCSKTLKDWDDRNKFTPDHSGDYAQRYKAAHK